MRDKSSPRSLNPCASSSHASPPPPPSSLCLCSYQYPLADASLIQVKGRPAVEVKLDGTVYDLGSGKVLSWCPKNTAVRKVLGALKDKQEAQDLPVYPVRIVGSKVMVNLSTSLST
jgi:nitrite reductase/ring-hydroxylating ferredoxin subunit